MDNGVDRQAQFNKRTMDELLDDWYIDEDVIDRIKMVEYRLYEMDCREVEDEV